MSDIRVEDLICGRMNLTSAPAHMRLRPKATGGLIGAEGDASFITRSPRDSCTKSGLVVPLP